MSQTHLHETREEKDMRVKPRNYPLIIFFWIALVALLGLFAYAIGR